MSNTKTYRLKQDFITPCFTVRAGVSLRESEWMERMVNLQEGDCDIKTDWFELVEKEVLFTTEDGVGVPKYGNSYYVSIDNDYMVTYHAGITIKKDYPYFSTPQAANEWILLNKPCLSISQVISEFKKCCDGTYSDDIDDWKFVDNTKRFTNLIKELAKSKINQ